MAHPDSALLGHPDSPSVVEGISGKWVLKNLDLTIIFPSFGNTPDSKRSEVVEIHFIESVQEPRLDGVCNDFVKELTVCREEGKPESSLFGGFPTA